jgi:hypothetical protein
METAAKRRLGDIFVDRGTITTAQLDEALAVQREAGGRIGEILVELGYVTRVALAGVIAEQWDDLRLTTRVRKAVEAPAPDHGSASVVEVALRERLEALTAELAEKDRRIARQDTTIAGLVAQLGDAAA